MQEQLTGLLYSVFLIILFGALIFRTILYFVIPQIYIVYKDDKFYLYPKKKTEIVLYPGEIKDVIRRHYKGRRYSRYAHRSGKLTIVHARGHGRIFSCGRSGIYLQEDRRNQGRLP